MALANTWTFYGKQIPVTGVDTMCAIWNDGARVIKIRRIGLINSQIYGVYGVNTRIWVQRLDSEVSWSGYLTMTPQPHDTNNSALSSVTCGHAGAMSTTGTIHTFLRYLWTTDEPASGSGGASFPTMDEWECMVPVNIIWDAGYGDSAVPKLTILENEALRIFNPSFGATGLVDVWTEFTDEA